MSVPSEFPTSMPTISPDFTYSDIENTVKNFFSNWLCNPQGGSPEICDGGTMWGDGAKAILQVVSGSFGMVYGGVKIVYGIGMLPFRAINAATGGTFFGLATGFGGFASGAALWSVKILTSPWHAVDVLMSAVVDTIHVLHHKSLIGGDGSILPRISPLHLILGSILLYSWLASSSKTENHSSGTSLAYQLQAAKAEKIIQRMQAERDKRKEKTGFKISNPFRINRN